MTYIPKKLIEIALPLEKIHEASAREKSIRHGHPSTLHLWWARRPLAAARAVIFSRMVDDPSEHISELLADPKKRQAAEKELQEQEAAWQERTGDYQKALAGGVVTLSPGVRPTLEDVVAEQDRCNHPSQARRTFQGGAGAPWARVREPHPGHLQSCQPQHQKGRRRL